MTKFNWEWETIRDFCGAFSHSHSQNEKKLYLLPYAVEMYAKRQAEVSHTSISEQKQPLIDLLINGCLIDYRSKIDCKQVIEKCLLESIRPSDKEVIAILDCIYIDIYPVGVELCADDIISGGFAARCMYL